MLKCSVTYNLIAPRTSSQSLQVLAANFSMITNLLFNTEPLLDLPFRKGQLLQFAELQRLPVSQSLCKILIYIVCSLKIQGRN